MTYLEVYQKRLFSVVVTAGVTEPEVKNSIIAVGLLFFYANSELKYDTNLNVFFSG